MKYRQSRTSFEQNVAQGLSERIGNFIRARYPLKTADSVEAETGISARTVSTWLRGSSSPNAAAMITLIETYGAEFLAAVVPAQAEWLSNAAREAARARLASEMLSLKSRMEALGG